MAEKTKTLVEAIDGVEQVVSVHVRLKPRTSAADARVIAANVATAIGTPIEVLYDIGGVTYTATFK